MATPTADVPDAHENDQPVDLIRGWDWASLIVAGIRRDLEATGKDPEQVAAGVAEQMQPLTDRIDEALANRANEATLDERVLALERKILMLREAHDLLLSLAIGRTEELRRLIRDEINRPHAPRGRSSTKMDETAKLIARRRRMLGQ